MELEINIEKKDRIKFIETIMRKKIIHINIFFVIFLTLVSFTFASDKSTSALFEIALGNVIFLICFFLVFCSLFFYFLRKTNFIPVGTVGEHKYYFAENSFIEETKGSTIESDYRDIKEVIERDKYYFIYLKSGGGYVFPKHEFNSAEKLENFKHIINNMKSSS